MEGVTTKEPEPGGPALARSIGPVQMTLYALGSMLGSGIYGLIGQSAGEVGNAVWLSFLVALVAALLTGLSYASLGSRYPRAGGAAYVTERAYGYPLLSFVVGAAVVCSGLTSVATQSRVFAGNLASLIDLEAAYVPLLALAFLLTLTAVVLRGIREAMWVNVVCTLLEAAGLLLVIAVGLPFWGSVDLLETPAGPFTPLDAQAWAIVLQGSVLTFFAFIGFEDTINVAEEARNPQRTIPLGLLMAMGIAALLYVAVAVTVVSVVPWGDLAVVPGPLTEVVRRAAPVVPPLLFTGITLFAVANTALVNYVTASRLLYGMARQGLIPASLGRVHARRRTPHVAIGALTLVLLPLVLSAGIAELAAATVLLLLFVFSIVNGALLLLQRRPGERRGSFEVPSLVPLLGAGVCVALVGARVAGGDWRAPAIAAVLLLGAVVLFLALPSAAPIQEEASPERTG